jgi:uncharacterized membrane protein YgcG
MVTAAPTGANATAGALANAPSTASAAGAGAPWEPTVEIPRANFDDLFMAMVAVFQVLSSEDWPSIMYDTRRGYGGTSLSSGTYFLSVVVVGNFIILNLFLAVLLGGFEDSRDMEEKEKEEARLEEEEKAKDAAEALEVESSMNPSPPPVPRPRSPPDHSAADDDGNYSGDNGNSRTGKGTSGEGHAAGEAGGSSRSGSGAAEEHAAVNPLHSGDLQNSDDLQKLRKRSVVPDHERSRRLGRVRYSLRLANESLQNASNQGGGPTEKGGVEDGFGGVGNVAKAELAQEPAGAGTVHTSWFLRFLSHLVGDAPVDGSGKALGLFPKEHPIRRHCSWLQHRRRFRHTVKLLVLASSAALAFETPLMDPESSLKQTLETLEVFFVLAFAMEASVKAVAAGFVANGPGSYLRNPWNQLDFFVVIASGIAVLPLADGKREWSPAFFSVSTLASVRSLRPLRVINDHKGIRAIMMALLKSVPGVLNVVLLLFLFFLVFAIIGVGFFKGAFNACQGGAFDALTVEQQNLVTYPRPFSALSLAEQAWSSGGGNSSLGWYESAGEAATSQAVCNWLGCQWSPTLISNFDSVTDGLLTLLEMSTTEGWAEVMWATTDARGEKMQPVRDTSRFAAAFSLLFILTGSFFMMNLFVGVIIDNFNRLRSDNDGDSLLLTEEQQHYINTLKLRLILAQVNDGQDGTALDHPDGSPVVRATRARTASLIQANEHAHKPVTVDPNSAYSRLQRACRVLAAPLPPPHDDPDGGNGGGDDGTARTRTRSSSSEAARHSSPSSASYRFEQLMMGCIILNTLAMSTYFLGIDEGTRRGLGRLSSTFSLIFTVEALIKVIGLGRRGYWTSYWNRFDATVVLVTDAALVLDWFDLLDIGAGPIVVRALRVARVAQLARRAAALRKLFATLLLTLPSLANIGSLLFLMYYVFAVIGVRLFARLKLGEHITAHANFRTFPDAFVTLLRCSTGEAWNSLMHEAAATSNCGAIPSVYNSSVCGYADSERGCEPIDGCGNWFAFPYFVSFSIVVTFVFLNLFIAVVLEAFSVSTEAAAGDATIEDAGHAAAAADTAVAEARRYAAQVAAEGGGELVVGSERRLDALVERWKGTDKAGGHAGWCHHWCCLHHHQHAQHHTDDPFRVALTAAWIALEPQLTLAIWEEPLLRLLAILPKPCGLGMTLKLVARGRHLCLVDVVTDGVGEGDGGGEGPGSGSTGGEIAGGGGVDSRGGGGGSGGGGGGQQRRTRKRKLSLAAPALETAASDKWRWDTKTRRRATERLRELQETAGLPAATLVGRRCFQFEDVALALGRFRLSRHQRGGGGCGGGGIGSARTKGQAQMDQTMYYKKGGVAAAGGGQGQKAKGSTAGHRGASPAKGSVQMARYKARAEAEEV